ncbi:hypothetical protein [Marinicella sp. W31]|uniref:hypothetical protein n=1 Tax=Marinicella sp. W31 TaxID=3023713 RepID=UPI003757FECE
MNHKILFLLLTALLLSGCGGGVRQKAELPTVINIQHLDFATGQISLLLKHRQRETTTANMLACQLAIKDGPTYQFSNNQIPDLTAYANELIKVTVDDLISTQSPYGDSFSYVLDCTLDSEEMSRQRPFNRSVMYRIPGKTTEYR